MCSLAVCRGRFPRYSLSDVSMDLGHGQRWHGSCESVVSENQKISSDEPVALLKIAFPSFLPSFLLADFHLTFIYKPLELKSNLHQLGFYKYREQFRVF